MAKLDTDSTGAAPDGWGPVLDKLLLGVTHHISNRVATLAGVSDILAGDPTIPPILRALTDEVPRLQEGIRLLRLLAGVEDETEEAVEATRLTDDAISLMQLHPDCQNVTFEMVGRREALPVVARPAALTHALVVALAAATTECLAPARIPVVFTSNGRELHITAGSHVVRARLLAARSD